MNKFKMRVKKRLTDELARIKSFSSDYYVGERAGINYALFAIDRIVAASEKPVVPQFVADWYEAHIGDDFEYNLYRLCVDFHDCDSDDNGLPEELENWFTDNSNEPIQTLVKMKLFDYEVDRGKLYTAKLKSTGEYLRYRREFKEIHHFKATDKDANNYEAYHFTKEELRKYNAWKNDAYDVKEVEE